MMMRRNGAPLILARPAARILRTTDSKPQRINDRDEWTDKKGKDHKDDTSRLVFRTDAPIPEPFRSLFLGLQHTARSDGRGTEKELRGSTLAFTPRSTVCTLGFTKPAGETGIDVKAIGLDGSERPLRLKGKKFAFYLLVKNDGHLEVHFHRGSLPDTYKLVDRRYRLCVTLRTPGVPDYVLESCVLEQFSKGPPANPLPSLFAVVPPPPLPTVPVMAPAPLAPAPLPLLTVPVVAPVPLAPAPLPLLTVPVVAPVPLAPLPLPIAPDTDTGTDDLMDIVLPVKVSQKRSRGCSPTTVFGESESDDEGDGSPLRRARHDDVAAPPSPTSIVGDDPASSEPAAHLEGLSFSVAPTSTAIFDLEFDPAAWGSLDWGSLDLGSDLDLLGRD